MGRDDNSSLLKISSQGHLASRIGPRVFLLLSAITHLPPWLAKAAAASGLNPAGLFINQHVFWGEPVSWPTSINQESRSRLSVNLTHVATSVVLASKSSHVEMYITANLKCIVYWTFDINKNALSSRGAQWGSIMSFSRQNLHMLKCILLFGKLEVVLDVIKNALSRGSSELVSGCLLILHSTHRIFNIL